MEDHYIDWYVLTIKKAWEDRPEPLAVRPRDFRALEILLHCHRQQLIRMAASRGETLKLDDRYEWVCTYTIAEIDKDMVVQSYYHIIQTGEPEKRAY
jgi:hypothetical protein